MLYPVEMIMQHCGKGHTKKRGLKTEGGLNLKCLFYLLEYEICGADSQRPNHPMEAILRCLELSKDCLCSSTQAFGRHK